MQHTSCRIGRRLCPCSRQETIHPQGVLSCPCGQPTWKVSISLSFSVLQCVIPGSVYFELYSRSLGLDLPGSLRRVQYSFLPSLCLQATSASTGHLRHLAHLSKLQKENPQLLYTDRLQAIASCQLSGLLCIVTFTSPGQDLRARCERHFHAGGGSIVCCGGALHIV